MKNFLLIFTALTMDENLKDKRVYQKSKKALVYYGPNSI